MYVHDGKNLMDNEAVQILIKEYIKDNLTIETEHNSALYGDPAYIKISLNLGTEMISSDYFDLD